MRFLAKNIDLPMIGEKIVFERKKRNWTQDELSTRSKIAQPIIAKYEKGHNPSQQNLIRISEAFKLPIEHFTHSLEIKVTSNERFSEIEFEKKLKEVRKCSVNHKQVVEKVIDLVLDMRQAHIGLENTKKHLHKS